MSVVEILALAAAVWLAVVLLGRFVVAPWLRGGPGGRADIGLIWRAVRIYVRLVHRVRCEDAHLLPARIDPSPGTPPGSADHRSHEGLIIVSNHTGSVDPLLLQAACPFFIRWLMARNMMIPQLQGLWRLADVIPVQRDGADAASIRMAMRHLREGGCIGIFPEGRIPTPPEEVRPFFAGVGTLAARTGSPVLLAWISGTPKTNRMLDGFLTPSRARVRFLEVYRFERTDDPEQITQRLRRRIAEESGWPINDEPQDPGGPSVEDGFHMAK
jgi:1-acyl-sn-glycerol-3-phosphate acyltransferase